MIPWMEKYALKYRSEDEKRYIEKCYFVGGLELMRTQAPQLWDSLRKSIEKSIAEHFLDQPPKIKNSSHKELEIVSEKHSRVLKLNFEPDRISQALKWELHCGDGKKDGCYGIGLSGFELTFFENEGRFQYPMKLLAEEILTKLIGGES